MIESDAMNALRQRLANATTEVDRLRAEVARLAEENRAYLASMRHMTAAAEDVLADARREAAETRARAAAEAYERLVVARADSRAAVWEERQRAAAEFELLAAVRERVTEERVELTRFHGHLSTRLHRLMHAMLEFTDRTPALGAMPGATIDDVIEVESEEHLDVTDSRTTPSPTMDPAAAADDELEQAFADFFSGDVDVEPSRSWILNEPLDRAEW